MASVDVGFEPWDLAEYVWVAVGVLLAIEWLRFARRRPPSAATPAGASLFRRFPLDPLRFVLGGAVLAIAATLLKKWRVPQDARGMTLGVAVLAALSVVWLVRSYRCTTRPLARAERASLVLLRCLVALGVLLFVSRPVLRWTRVIEDRGTIVMLLDDSRSMTLRDATISPDHPAVTRLECLRRVLSDNAATIGHIRNTRDLRAAAFDTELREADPDRLRGAGRYTALARAIREGVAGAVQDGRRVVGVLLFTDGGENYSAADPLVVAEEIGRAGTALWIVGLGSEVPAGQTRGLVARRLDAPPRVSVFNQLSARAELLAMGLAGREVRVELLHDDERVDQKTLRPAGPREVLSPVLHHTPSAPGMHRITLRATAPDLEPDRRTVTLSQFVYVTQDAVQVLYIDRPRYERAGIARAVEPARELRLTKSQAGADRLPRTAEEWSTYDVVIVGDVRPDAVSRSQYEAMRDLVLRRGRGVLVLAGERALGAGAFADTALVDVLPMDASRVRRRAGEHRVEPTLTGLSHPVCRMIDTASAPATSPAWPVLPPASQLDAMEQLKPAAQVLLATKRGEPVLVVQEVGTGRAAVLAIDSTWQWPMRLANGDELHRRFWRQLLLWLANRRPAVWVAANQPRYQLPRLTAGAETIVVEAGVATFGAEAQPRRVELSGRLVGPGGVAQPLTFVRRGETYEARPTVTKDGEYQVEASGLIDGMRTDTARAAFVVESPDIEMTEAVANFELLRRMAERTASAGGEFVTAEAASGLFDRILASDHTVRRTLTQTSNLFDAARTPLLAVVIALLILEWVIRKWRGLV